MRWVTIFIVVACSDAGIYQVAVMVDSWLHVQGSLRYCTAYLLMLLEEPASRPNLWTNTNVGHRLVDGQLQCCRTMDSSESKSGLMAAPLTIKAVHSYLLLNTWDIIIRSSSCVIYTHTSRTTNSLANVLVMSIKLRTVQSSTQWGAACSIFYATRRFTEHTQRTLIGAVHAVSLNQFR